MDFTMSLTDILKYELQNVLPIPMIGYILLLLAFVYIIGKYDVPYSFGLLALTLLAGTIVLYESSLSFIYFILLFIIYVVIVIAIYAVSRHGE